MNTKLRQSTAAIALCALCPALGYADGIDLIAYFSRTPCENALGALPVAALLMLANYGLNYVAIGVPVLKISQRPARQVSRDLIWLTLLGQIADRLGAVLAGLLTTPVMNMFGLKGEGAWAAPLLGMNFFFSAISIAIIVFAFAWRKWELPLRHSAWVSIAAGLVTNPAWSMGLWFMR